jgi:hypothetical protein
VVSALRAFTLVFFVPSLAIRYWGTHETALFAGALLVLAGLVAGVVKASRLVRPSPAGLLRLALAAALALVCGGGVAGHVAGGALAAIPELTFARVALSFLATAIVSFRGAEIALCWAAHETKAEADEA